MVDFDVRVVPTKRLVLLGIDERSIENLAWCAVTYGMNRLFWVDGYLLCVEVYEKSFEHEIEKKEIPVSHVCYAKLPKYERVYEVGKGMQIPIVNASDMKMLRSILKAILNRKTKAEEENSDPPTGESNTGNIYS